MSNHGMVAAHKLLKKANQMSNHGMVAAHKLLKMILTSIG